MAILQDPSGGRPKSAAAVLGIGTEVPPTVAEQSEYPDFFFGSTGSKHKTELKAKFGRICEKSGIQRRHMAITPQLLAEHPSIASYKDSSLDVRREILMKEVPRLAAQASRRAIQDWGRPASDITHVVMTTSSCAHMPGPEVALMKLLGLRADTRRIMLFLHGCYGGATLVRVAKDLAENNPGARVLAVAADLSVVYFRAPSADYIDGLLGAALFGDGAAAAAVGAGPTTVHPERPVFEVHWSGETLLPDSDGAIDGVVCEAGLTYHLRKDVPTIIEKHIHGFLAQVVTEGGLRHECNANLQVEHEEGSLMSYDDMFWAVHPGGPAILDKMDKVMKLSGQKLACSRHVLAQCGNMLSSSVLFVLDRMRQQSKDRGFSGTGEGCSWGMLVAFGPGITVEASVIKSCRL